MVPTGTDMEVLHLIRYRQMIIVQRVPLLKVPDPLSGRCVAQPIGVFLRFFYICGQKLLHVLCYLGELLPDRIKSLAGDLQCLAVAQQDDIHFASGHTHGALCVKDQLVLSPQVGQALLATYGLIAR